MIKNSLKYILIGGLLIHFNLSFAQDKVEVSVVDLGNVEKAYAPSYYKNGLVFCGVGVQNEAITIVEKDTEKPLTDLFFISEKNGNYSVPKLFSSALKTSFHDGPITFSKDGETAYFTRSLSINVKLKNRTKEKNRLGVFKATYDGNEWGNVKPCPFNSAEYNIGQPTLSKDGKTLYVVSDKEGGFGGKDIYSIKINGDSYGKLTNLGDEINTAANELFPFITATNDLYYASDKKGGYGGLDVYFSSISYGFWNIPTHLDTNINSSFDDFGIVWNSKNREAYFSSNRDGKDQLYKVNISYPDFGNCEEVRETQLCFEFFEVATLNADSIAMVYEWDFGDGIKEQTLETFHCYDKAGLYMVELNVMDSMIDKTFVNEATYELEILEVIQPQITCFDSVFVDEEFSVEVQQGTWLAFKMLNYYIDYGDSVILKNAGFTHTYDSAGVKEIKVLIAGKDSLSGEILIACFYKTIKVKSKVRLGDAAMGLMEKQGFTATKMLNNNVSSFYVLELFTSSTSVKEDPLAFKGLKGVSETYNAETKEYVYTTEKANSPYELILVFRKAHQLGFDKAELKQIGTDSNAVLLPDFGKLEVDEEGNANMVLKGIYFGRNEYELNQESKLELDKLSLYLAENPEIKIEIEAYTDATKDETSNLKLSQKRANSVLSYLVHKGVKRKRLKAYGYGETKPIASNETEEGRAKNRRVAFKILAQ